MLMQHIEAVSALAKSYELEPATLMAVVAVESSGQTFTKVSGRDMPLIRWEGHYFDRLIKASLRDRARREKLASPKTEAKGGIRNPRSQEGRYDMLAAAAQIDADAAYQSISIGVGQVMGSHAVKLGFTDAKAMLDYACQGFAAQIDIMLRYIKAFSLLDELQRFDWTGFARGYNGPNYAAGRYHTKLANAYEEYAGVVSPASKAAGMLRMGSKGSAVREVQKLLVRAGVAIKVDGDYGLSTKLGVMAFQRAYGLEVDGVVGPTTLAELSQFRATQDEVLDTTPALDVAETKQGLLGAGSGLTLELANSQIQEAADKLAGVAGDSVLLNLVSSGLTTLAAILVVAGLAYAAYGWIKARTE